MTTDVTVTTTADCTWTAVSAVAWVAVVSGASGAGNGSVRLDIQSNPASARTGTVAIAGRTVTVTQPCGFAISPTSQAVPVGGGTGTVTVTTGAECPWTAVSSVSWITITAGASGSANGAVSFTVDANTTGAPRTGTLTIAGLTFTVDQAAADLASR
jgi:hypothetical protein